MKPLHVKHRYLPPMRKTFFMLLIVASSLNTGCNSCVEGNGPRVSRFTPTDSVGEVILDMVSDVLVKVDSARDNIIEVIAQEEIQPVVMANNDQGLLTLSLDECLENNQPILFELTLNEANRFVINSAGLIENERILKQPKVWFTNRGLGDIDFAVDSDEIISEIRSSGNMILSGECNRMDFLSTSSGDLRAYNLVADTLVLNIFGSTVCDVYATQYLEVNFFSSGRVNYRGNPKEVKVNGEGQVTQTSI